MALKLELQGPNPGLINPVSPLATVVTILTYVERIITFLISFFNLELGFVSVE